MEPVIATLRRHKKERLNILHRHKDTRRVIDGKLTYICTNKNTFYKDLKKQYPNLEKYTNTQIAKYIIEFNKLLGAAIIENRDGITLPEYIGNIFVGSYKKYGKEIDYKTSGKVGKLVYFQNRHSQGYMFKLFYTYNLQKYNFANCDYWKFIPCRALRTTISDIYKVDWKKYIVIPHVKHINNFIKSYYIKKTIENTQKGAIEDYNEFAL